MSNLNHLHTAALFAPLGILHGLAAKDKPPSDPALANYGSQNSSLNAAADFLAVCRKTVGPRGDAILPSVSEEILRGVKSKGHFKRFIETARQCIAGRASKARAADEKRTIRRLSPFTAVGKNARASHSDRFKDIKKLSLERNAGFPVNKDNPIDAAEIQAYHQLLQSFLGELPEMRNERALQALMRKYLSAFASGASSISGLDQEAKLTAALTWCLASYFSDTTNNDAASEFLQNPFASDQKPFLLVKGDMSGIQDFIFNINSKGAAKRLKSRSVLVQLIGEAAIENIVDEFDLPRTCILNNSGGNFTILVPNCFEEQLYVLRRRFENALLKTELYLALGWTEVSALELRDNAKAVLVRAGKMCQIVKTQKYRTLEYSCVFRADDQGNLIEAYLDLAKSLRDWDALALTQVPKLHAKDTTPVDWIEVLHRFACHPEYQDTRPDDAVLFNKTDFVDRASDFRFMVKDLPTWTEKTVAKYREKYHELIDRDPDGFDDLVKDKLIEFSHLGNLALESSGRDEIGVVKLDVDNLGALFNDGLDDTVYLMAHQSVSDALHWFFEGYLTNLIQQDEFKNRIYTVFSGGDDVFLLGPWDSVFEFVRKLREEFRQYTCHRRKVTFSAGLIMVRAKSSVTRFTELAEQALDHAKEHRGESGEIIKNAINVFGETLSWDCFDEAAKIKDKLVTLIEEYGAGRDLLFKVHQLCFELQEYLKNNEKGHVPPVWRLSHLMRDLTKTHSEKVVNKATTELVGELIKQFEQIFLASATNSPLGNPMLFDVAAHWAEYSLKKSESNHLVN